MERIRNKPASESQVPSLPVSTVVYICGPLDTFLNIMKLFQSEIQDPENYAIFYLDVFAESLAEGKPWQKSDTEWLDPISVFKVSLLRGHIHFVFGIISKHFHVTLLI